MTRFMLIFDEPRGADGAKETIGTDTSSKFSRPSSYRPLCRLYFQKVVQA